MGGAAAEDGDDEEEENEDAAGDGIGPQMALGAEPSRGGCLAPGGSQKSDTGSRQSCPVRPHIRCNSSSLGPPQLHLSEPAEPAPASALHPRDSGMTLNRARCVSPFIGKEPQSTKVVLFLSCFSQTVSERCSRTWAKSSRCPQPTVGTPHFQDTQVPHTEMLELIHVN